jgi:hypothetical protein
MAYKNKSTPSASLTLSKSGPCGRSQLTMDSSADMRNVTTILLSEDSSSSTGRVDIATWAMVPTREARKK